MGRRRWVLGSFVLVCAVSIAAPTGRDALRADLHVLDEGNHWSTAITSRPYHSALYSIGLWSRCESEPRNLGDATGCEAQNPTREGWNPPHLSVGSKSSSTTT